MIGPKCELLSWYRITDLLLGDNETNQDIAAALELARSCQHAGAAWLVSLFPDGRPVTNEVARDVLLAQGEDARAVHLGGCVCQPAVCLELVRQAAELGYGPAQGVMAYLCDGPETARWAEKAAAQGDRLGLFCFAHCLWNGYGCDMDRERAAKLYREAAELNLHMAQYWYGERCFGVNDAERYQWLGHAERYQWLGRAAGGHENAIIDLSKAATAQLTLLDDGGSGRIVFEIGAALKERARAEGILPEHLQKAVALHAEWCAAAERAICCWVWVGRHFKMVKDVR